jgi:hypothetical protein
MEARRGEKVFGDIQKLDAATPLLVAPDRSEKEPQFLRIFIVLTDSCNV